MRNINVNIGDEVSIKAVVVDYNEGGDGMVKVRIDGLSENRAGTASRHMWLYYDEIQHENSEEMPTPQHLPFNIGEVVYIIRNNKIEPGKIKSIIINERGVEYWYEQAKFYGEWKFSIKSIGNSVFKSWQEAADKLTGGDSFE